MSPGAKLEPGPGLEPEPRTQPNPTVHRQTYPSATVDRGSGRGSIPESGPSHDAQRWPARDLALPRAQNPTGRNPEPVGPDLPPATCAPGAWPQTDRPETPGPDGDPTLATGRANWGQGANLRPPRALPSLVRRSRDRPRTHQRAEHAPPERDGPSPARAQRPSYRSNKTGADQPLIPRPESPPRTRRAAKPRNRPRTGCGPKNHKDPTEPRTERQGRLAFHVKRRRTGRGTRAGANRTRTEPRPERRGPDADPTGGRTRSGTEADWTRTRTEGGRDPERRRTGRGTRNGGERDP